MPGGKLEAWRESRSTRETLPRNALILPVYREYLPARCAPSALAVWGLHLTVRVIPRRFSWNFSSSSLAAFPVNIRHQVHEKEQRSCSRQGEYSVKPNRYRDLFNSKNQDRKRDYRDAHPTQMEATWRRVRHVYNPLTDVCSDDSARDTRCFGRTLP